MMLATLALLFYHLPLSVAEPRCADPPPEPIRIPYIHDCQELVNIIDGISMQEHGEPFLWSRHPSQGVRSRKLPYVFRDPLSRDNDCAFVVTWVGDDQNEDTFPTRLVAEGADEIVELCLERGIEGVPMIGAVHIGPRNVIAIVLVRDKRTLGAVVGGLVQMNMTNASLLRLGNISVPISSLTDA